MQDFYLTFRGKRLECDALIDGFGELDAVNEVVVTSVSRPSGGVLSRDPLNQLEVVDVVVAFAINLAAAYTYDQIRAMLTEIAKDRGFVRHDAETPPPPTLD